MGTYTDLTVAGYPLILTKSAVVPEVMTVFRETDRREFQRRVSERNVLVWGEPEDSSEDELETVIEYSCETSNAIDRLDVMGFTLRRVRQEFEAGLKAEREECDSWEDDKSDSSWFTEREKLFKTLTFDTYASALARVVAEGLRPVPFGDHEKAGQDPIIKYGLFQNL